MEMYRTKILKIEWLDQDNPEAEVLFVINGKSLWAFCHPCYLNESEIIEVRLTFIEDEIDQDAFWIENSQQKKEIVQSEDNRLSYFCYGEIVSINPLMIDCGFVVFSYGDWINDPTIIGKYVYFVISRLIVTKI